MLLQHSTATQYSIDHLNDELNVTVYDNTLLQHTLQHTTIAHYCNMLLQHSTATQYSSDHVNDELNITVHDNTLLQHTHQHTTTTYHCNNHCNDKLITTGFLREGRTKKKLGKKNVTRFSPLIRYA